MKYNFHRRGAENAENAERRYFLFSLLRVLCVSAVVILIGVHRCPIGG
jgi:hypothetical protein